MKSTKDIMNDIDDKLLLHYELNYVNNLKSQLQYYKQQIDKIDKLLKVYSCRINKGFPYDKVYVFKSDPINEDQFLDLKVIINDFKQILKEGDDL